MTFSLKFHVSNNPNVVGWIDMSKETMQLLYITTNDGQSYRPELQQKNIHGNRFQNMPKMKT
jgi:hypothetical protein